MDVVIVGDSAGRLDLVISECVLHLLGDLPRVGSSVVTLTSLVVGLVTIGGGRLLSRGDGVVGSSGNSVDEDEGESGRGMLRGSTVSAEGIGGSVYVIYPVSKRRQLNKNEMNLFDFGYGGILFWDVREQTSPRNRIDRDRSLRSEQRLGRCRNGELESLLLFCVPRRIRFVKLFKVQRV